MAGSGRVAFISQRVSGTTAGAPPAKTLPLLATSIEMYLSHRELQRKHCGVTKKKKKKSAG